MQNDGTLFSKVVVQSDPASPVSQNPRPRVPASALPFRTRFPLWPGEPPPETSKCHTTGLLRPSTQGPGAGQGSPRLRLFCLLHLTTLPFLSRRHPHPEATTPDSQYGSKTSLARAFCGMPKRRRRCEGPRQSSGMAQVQTQYIPGSSSEGASSEKPLMVPDWSSPFSAARDQALWPCCSSPWRLSLCDITPVIYVFLRVFLPPFSLIGMQVSTRPGTVNQ